MATPPKKNAPTVKEQRAEKRAAQLEAFKRQEAARKRNRLLGIIGAIVALVLVVGTVATVFIVNLQPPAPQEVDDDLVSGDYEERLQTFDGLDGTHTESRVTYEQTPPVGGPHNPAWLNCGVYDQEQQNENAVHALEHGAVWITYDPEALSEDEIASLAEYADESGRMLSPFEGQDSPISLQSWNHQLKVDSVDDPRIEQFTEFFTYNADFYPEPGASCENPVFAADPLVAGEGSAPVGEEMPSDAPSGETTDPGTEPSETPAP
jgi:hypothetical protein